MVVAMAMTACAKNEEAKDSEGSGADELCPADGSGPKIGLAYDVGGRGDQSFNDLAAKGVSDAAESLDATCTEQEATAGEAESAKEERLRTLADADHNPIIAVGAAYAEAAAKVAVEYPDISFAVVDGFSEADNITNLVFAPEQGAYLVGMAAGLKTETDKLGFVGGVKGPVIDPFAAGFQAGAKAVNPKVKVEFKWLSDALDDKAFRNVPGGRTAATALYDGGADIVFHAAGESGLGVFEAADEADKWAIGVDADQYLAADEKFKDNILTSSLKRVDVAVLDYIEAFDAGEVQAGFDLFDMKRDGVGYATSGGYIDDITDQLEEAKTKIVSGEIKVPNTL
jgi:basic membrane protein A